MRNPLSAISLSVESASDRVRTVLSPKLSPKGRENIEEALSELMVVELCTSEFEHVNTYAVLM